MALRLDPYQNLIAINFPSAPPIVWETQMFETDVQSLPITVESDAPLVYESDSDNLLTIDMEETIRAMRAASLPTASILVTFKCSQPGPGSINWFSGIRLKVPDDPPPSYPPFFNWDLDGMSPGSANDAEVTIRFDLRGDTQVGPTGKPLPNIVLISEEYS